MLSKCQSRCGLSDQPEELEGYDILFDRLQFASDWMRTLSFPRCDTHDPRIMANVDSDAPILSPES